MARNQAVNTSPATTGWDVEELRELTSEAEGHINGGTMYVTALLWSRMREAWGGVVTHIKTKTDPATGEVRVSKAEAGEQGAVRVRKTKSLNAAEFSFVRPLRKLGVVVPKDRMYKVTPQTEEMEGVGTVFVFPVSGAESIPRKKREAAVPKTEM